MRRPTNATSWASAQMCLSLPTSAPQVAEIHICDSQIQCSNHRLLCYFSILYPFCLCGRVFGAGGCQLGAKLPGLGHERRRYRLALSVHHQQCQHAAHGQGWAHIPVYINSLGASACLPHCQKTRPQPHGENLSSKEFLEILCWLAPRHLSSSEKIFRLIFITL